MSGPIVAKIDVTQIAKEKFFIGKPAKDGHIPKYMDIVLIPKKDGPDQYGNDFMVVQGTTKEERQAGVKGKILGNARFMGQPQSQPATPEPPPPCNEDEVPF
jgi:hypothetical protein